MCKITYYAGVGGCRISIRKFCSSTLIERTYDKNAYMDQLHKNRFQVAKHRPGLNIKAELLFKITAEGDLESKRERER